MMLIKSSKGKARKRRLESKIIHMVRMHDVARDGYCRVGKDVRDYIDACDGLVADNYRCDGDSQLMHLENARRFKTRGRNPELRHTTAGTCMGCAKHHDMYDGRRRPRLSVELLSNAGADGAMVWRLT